MFESIMKLVRKVTKKEDQTLKSKDAAKERLHLVLMQDRANVSADFLDLMKQEIIDVIKKYIEIDESAIDVKLTNKDNGDGTNGAPALYANIPILNIKDEVRQTAKVKTKDEEKKENFINDNEEKKETLLEDNQEKEEITKTKEPDVEIIYRNLEEKVKEILGTKVQISHKKNNSGKIEIEYYSNEELERIMDLLESIHQEA